MEEERNKTKKLGKQGRGTTFCTSFAVQWKFEVASVRVSDALLTLFTTMVSPVTLVTRTSTESTPKPLEFWKKLYSCRLRGCQVFPPSILTSRDLTGTFELTTCMLNQYLEEPLWVFRNRGLLMPHLTISHSTLIRPTLRSASC